MAGLSKRLCELAVALVTAATLVAAPTVSAGTIRIEETEITLVGEDWIVESFPPFGFADEYSEDRAVYANFRILEPEAFASFEFDGTGVTWIGARTFNAGLFEWIVDEGTTEERRGTVNTYIPGVERFTTELLVDDLVPGRHTFRFNSLGINGRTLQAELPAETYIDAFDITVVPESGTFALIGLGLAGLGFARRRVDAKGAY